MIFFHSHIGSAFRHASMFSKRILVLGESHYCAEACADCGSRQHPECAGFTRKVVADYLNPCNEREGWMNTYLKFERSLVGHETTPDESRRIWDNIAFYNYLQVAMGGPRKAGTAEQYQAAAEPFSPSSTGCIPICSLCGARGFGTICLPKGGRMAKPSLWKAIPFKTAIISFRMTSASAPFASIILQRATTGPIGTK